MPSDTIKVHNAELYVEAMQSADWSLSEAQRRAREEMAGSKDNKNKKSSSLSNSISSAPNSGKFAPSSSDALAGKRAVLEAEFRAKMDIAKRESDRRSHEKTLRQEKQFEDRYASFMAKNREIVTDSKMHEEVSLVKERKRERLYQDWMQKVFLPMQGEINSKIDSADTEDIIAFRNQQYQAYLDECNRTQKNGGGVHRDVIVPTQYDPSILNRAATVKYATVGLADDPLKNRITRESQLPGGSNASHPQPTASSTAPHSSSLTGSRAVFTSSQLPKRTNAFDAQEEGATSPSKKAGGLSTRFGGVMHGSYAQSHAHASKFQLFPSEALGTVSNGDGNANQSNVFNNSDFLSTTLNQPAHRVGATVIPSSSSSSGRGVTTVSEARLLPSVGNATGLTSNNATGRGNNTNTHPAAFSSIGTAFRNGGSHPQPLPTASSMSRIIATNAEPRYRYSANTSLFNSTVEPIPVRSTLVDVKQWGRMDATPHGRYSEDNVGPSGRPRVSPPAHKAGMERPGAVVFDHYNMPRGEEGVKQTKAEISGTGKGKKCDYSDKSTPNPLS